MAVSRRSLHHACRVVRVIEQLTAAAGRRPGAKKTAARASAKRQSSVEAEIDVIRTSIRRKTTAPPAKRLPTRILPANPDGTAERGNLLVRGQSVQTFHQPTGFTRWCVLAVFKKEGWSGRIHDPLPSKPDADNRPAPGRYGAAAGSNRIPSCALNWTLLHWAMVWAAARAPYPIRLETAFDPVRKEGRVILFQAKLACILRELAKFETV